MSKKVLGKGLGALIAAETGENSGVMELRINDIEPNLDQPRKVFDDEKLLQLCESIKQHGVVQPIIVKKEKDTYRIVAGERRWRAARMAGLETIPAVIKDLTDRQLMEVALIENLQREDLNPIEEAEAYEKLIKEYNMTQEEISETIGKSRSAIANTVRLLSLSQKVKNYIIEGKLTSGHARTLVTIEDEDLQGKIADEIINKALNVRETEKLLKKYNENKKKKPKRKDPEDNAEFIKIEEKLKAVFGTQVHLVSGNKKGKIVIEYYSPDDLERILELVDSINKNN